MACQIDTPALGDHAVQSTLTGRHRPSPELVDETAQVEALSLSAPIVRKVEHEKVAARRALDKAAHRHTYGETWPLLLFDLSPPEA